MTFQEFSDGIKKLKETFGERTYPHTRTELFWNRLRNMDGHWWHSHVDRWCQDRVAPLGPQISEALQDSQKTKYQKLRPFEGLIKCRWGNHKKSAQIVECEECITEGHMVEICTNPYSFRIPPELQEMANFFKRQKEESLPAYAERTHERREEIMSLYGLRCGNVAAVKKFLEDGIPYQALLKK